jgi:hypothetical protein
MSNLQAIVNVFADVAKTAEQDACKVAIMPSPLPFSRLELEMVARSLEIAQKMTPAPLAAREAHFKVCSLIGAMAKWEREH